jgi:cytochrome c-type biogenesis protein
VDGLTTASVLIPIGLGLLGFVEPCAIGAHLTFAGTLTGRPRSEQVSASMLFVVVRTLTMGLVGVVAALASQSVALGQRTFWVVFGVAYVVLGALYLADRAGILARGVGPVARPRSILLLGAAFGLAIPACAAPLLFAASGAAAGAGGIGRAFVAMVLFGLALSAPLLVLVVVPRSAALLSWASARRRALRRVAGVVLVAVGVWGVWFGVFVDPADWR